MLKPKPNTENAERKKNQFVNISYTRVPIGIHNGSSSVRMRVMDEI